MAVNRYDSTYYVFANEYNIDIRFPYASYDVLTSILVNENNNMSRQCKNRPKNLSGLEISAKRELMDIISNPDNRINYLIDKRAINLCDNYDALEKTYIFHVWLEKFKVEFDF